MSLLKKRLAMDPIWRPACDQLLCGALLKGPSLKKNQLGEQAVCIALGGSYRWGWFSLEYGSGLASFEDSRLP